MFCVLCVFFFFFRNFLRFDYKSGRRGRFYARLLHYFRALKTIKFSFEPSSFWLLGNPLNQTPAGVGVGVGYLVLVVIFVVDWVGLSLRRQVVPRYLFLHIFLNGVLLPWLLMRFSGSWTVASLTFFFFSYFFLCLYIFFFSLHARRPALALNAFLMNWVTIPLTATQRWVITVNCVNDFNRKYKAQQPEQSRAAALNSPATEPERERQEKREQQE